MTLDQIKEQILKALDSHSSQLETVEVFIGSGMRQLFSGSYTLSGSYATEEDKKAIELYGKEMQDKDLREEFEVLGWYPWDVAPDYVKTAFRVNAKEPSKISFTDALKLMESQSRMSRRLAEVQKEKQKD